MSFTITLLAVVAFVYLAIKQMSGTDIPKIKGVPEIPGVPIFGSLIQLGKSHARSCRKFAAKYGPIFQIRLGNRVSPRGYMPSNHPVANADDSALSTSTDLRLSKISGLAKAMLLFLVPRPGCGARWSRQRRALHWQPRPGLRA